ncbi:hypothetical protein BaRGS_00009292 [Batillaria attramentaria]|uniref:Uncharacterized protein n=1 Tax=Batillaria attramentaria TaxID=370345 RepID=A0ABD0LJD7_9CAEN
MPWPSGSSLRPVKQDTQLPAFSVQRIQFHGPVFFFLTCLASKQGYAEFLEAHRVDQISAHVELTDRAPPSGPVHTTPPPHPPTTPFSYPFAMQLSRS